MSIDKSQVSKSEFPFPPWKPDLLGKLYDMTMLVLICL